MTENTPNSFRTAFIALLIICLITAFYLYTNQFFTFETIYRYHEKLLRWTQAYYMRVVLCYIFIYILLALLSMPGTPLLTVTGGFLFGKLAGVFYVLISATFGASLLFLAVRNLFATLFLKRAGPWLKKFEFSFQQNAVNYLLFLRLVPVFPFWLVNIITALLGVRLSLFFATTLFGIIPATLIYVSLGDSLGHLIAQGQAPNLNIIFEPQTLLSLSGLAILSIIPVIYRWYQKN